ncbi:galactosylceramidase [Nocardioides immobilis]|uniref:galactosylceramidase n=1 Tax=Nocardioides immobilis TaxID=2049295 RepID=A0A417XTU7_9ACTN|nr:galactosylceramidase [Nocardioides immobilis]
MHRRTSRVIAATSRSRRCAAVLASAALALAPAPVAAQSAALPNLAPAVQAKSALVAAAGDITPIVVSKQGAGRRFDGVGALSAGAASRLLVDYPEPQRSRILDYLFKPNFGASFQMLKVELGGDANSTGGTEPSHMRSSNEVNCYRGYEWWIMKEAKKRNPSIKLLGLEWGAPGWVGAGTGTVWTKQNIRYYISWVDCARKHGLKIDYLGGWNEKSYDVEWFKDLRAALDRRGYKDVGIVGDDGVNNWRFAEEMASDPDLYRAIDVAGVHYPCGFPNGETCPSTPGAQRLGKPLWASEQTPFQVRANVSGLPIVTTFDNFDSYNTGAGRMAGQLNRVYIDGAMTGTIIWNLIWSSYPGLPFEGAGPILADTPWSGTFRLGKTMWSIAHTTQFARPGWRYVNTGSKRLPAGGSVVTLRSGARSKTPQRWSSIVETSDASEAQRLRFQLERGMSADPVHVWATNLDSTSNGDSFRRVATIRPRLRAFVFDAQPGFVYSLTTSRGQKKGETGQMPPQRAFPFPYADDFSRYEAGRIPRYLSDFGGSFEVAPCAGQPGRCLEQKVTQEPVRWQLTPAPATLIGDPHWSNYTVTSDAYIPESGYVEIVGRASAPQVAFFPGFASGLEGYHFRIDAQGEWLLYRQTATETFDPTGANNSFVPIIVDTPLATGTDPSLVGKSWHKMQMRLLGPTITISLDDKLLIAVADPVHTAGQAALAVSRWNRGQFRNIAIDEAAVVN